MTGRRRPPDDVFGNGLELLDERLDPDPDLADDRLDHLAHVFGEPVRVLHHTGRGVGETARALCDAGGGATDARGHTADAGRGEAPRAERLLLDGGAGPAGLADDLGLERPELALGTAAGVAGSTGDLGGHLTAADLGLLEPDHARAHGDVAGVLDVLGDVDHGVLPLRIAHNSMQKC